MSLKMRPILSPPPPRPPPPRRASAASETTRRSPRSPTRRWRRRPPRPRMLPGRSRRSSPGPDRRRGRWAGRRSSFPSSPSPSLRSAVPLSIGGTRSRTTVARGSSSGRIWRDDIDVVRRCPRGRRSSREGAEGTSPPPRRIFLGTPRTMRRRSRRASGRSSPPAAKIPPAPADIAEPSRRVDGSRASPASNHRRSRLGVGTVEGMRALSRRWAPLRIKAAGLDEECHRSVSEVRIAPESNESAQKVTPTMQAPTRRWDAETKNGAVSDDCFDKLFLPIG
mmetsp:Transcript_59778/g.177151  ORF Transcript_59778/g.177151 Transcript_59778/m.177151 type:complete len:280 (-) Transcript_59778:183-1022(-)